MAKFQRRRGRDVPFSKRIRNNPNVTQGHKLQRLEGGGITRKPLPDGRVLVTTVHGDGSTTWTIEENPHDHH